ncbi:MAG TPA: response regulator [Actinomycetota bacterium]|nr:response regulator [Actinomycetota bacterium]
MPTAPSPTRRDASRATLRVLVVDDNAGFRESLVSLLDTGNLVVVAEAENGQQALELLDRVEPDVVLMDVRMPVVDGIEATRRLKRRRPEIGVVALTGNEDHAAVRDMLVAGASGYVLKDSDAEDILRAIRQAASGRGMISPQVTRALIEELAEALDRERRRARELELAQQALVERAARRQELLARLGHELRTPVTVILGMAQTLQKGAVPEEERPRLLDRLVARTADLAHLVERLEVAVAVGLDEQVDLPALVREIAAGDPRVRVVAPPDLPPVPLAPGAARRVLEELLDNALRFSEPPAPVVVAIEPTAEGLEVRVIDRGPGIGPEARGRIFDPLEQEESLNVRRHPGAGMGLTLARTAARAMEGDVELEESGPGGSTFLWRIPRRD